MSASGQEAYLGIDIGTTSVKVLAAAADGTVLASASRKYPHETPSPERVEQDADKVYAGVLEALHETTAALAERGARPSAIGFSCAMHGVLPVDAGGMTLGPMITWMDRRSAKVADAWRDDGTAARLYARTGAPMHPMLPSCKLRWLRDNDSGPYARADKFVSIKELIVRRWTGEWLIDWGMASGTGLFDVRAHEWSDRALEVARVDRAKLSKPAKPSTTLRSLDENIARDMGLPNDVAIVLASSDGALANLGAGAVGERDLALTLGTSGALRTVSPRAHFDAQGRTFCYAFDDDHYLLGGPTSSAGGVLDRLHELFLDDIAPQDRFARAVEQAATIAPGAGGLVLLPFLSGERAPYWNAHVRGGYAGLDLSHTRAHFLRAGFEGVVFALASVFEIMREGLQDIEVVRLSGGLTHAALVRQLIADVFALPAMTTDHDEASAFGAAMYAAIATGALRGVEAVPALLHETEHRKPDPATSEAYAAAFARYRACAEANLTLYAV